MYTQLMTKSAYSLLESTLTIKEYVEKASNLGYKSLGLTDHNVLHGAIEFYQACQAKEIQPIIGLTLDYFSPLFEESFAIYVLAKSNHGYQQLMSLSSRKMINDDHNLLNNMDLSELIFVLPEENEVRKALESNSPLEQTIYSKVEQFQLYFGVSSSMLQSDIFESLQSQMKDNSIRPVAIEELNSSNGTDTLAIRVMTHIQKGSVITREELSEKTERLTELKEPKEMAAPFSSYPEAIVNLEALVATCKIEIPLHQSLLPKYPVEKGESADKLLDRLCRESLAQKNLANDSRYIERLNYELQIINQMGFVNYFLIVWDVMDYAHRHQVITGAGRGSAAGSLVSYLLKITEVDPIEYDLLFERFLNPERFSMPDIDLDIPDNRREEILNYVKEKYGQDFVAQIATFGTMAAKMVLRDVARVFGLSQSESNRWSNAIPKKLKINLAESFKESKQLRELVQHNERNQLLFSVAQTLEGLPRHVSTHAAGVIISDQNLWNLVPLLPGSNDIFLTQFTMKDVETMGLLKMDFLGLRNLAIIDDTLKGIKYLSKKNVTQAEIPLDDSQTIELFKRGDTSGIFQFESVGIKNVLRKLQPDNLEDIAAVNALYRPGPMSMIDTFVRRKKGQEPITYPDVSLEGILRITYGIMVYQEQVMQVASKLAGFTLGEADILRRAISKKNKAELDKQRIKFIEGTIHNGHNEQTANLVYDYIEKFGDYGFNRSHAFAYSIIGYQMAFLKVHYPVAFYRALLLSVQGNHAKIREYVSDAQRFNVRISPPSINTSFGGFSIVSETTLRFGLNSIKGLRNEFIKTILQNRNKQGPFQSLDQFLLRISLENSKLLKEEQLIALINVGAFDELDSNRRKLIQQLEGKLQNLAFSAGSMDLLEMMPLKSSEIEDFTLAEKLSYEEELLGLYVSGHPVQAYGAIQKQLNTTFISDFENKKEVQVIAYVKNKREIRTKKGEMMGFADVTDQTGNMTIILFPEAYRQFKKYLLLETVLFFEGKFEQSTYNGENQLVVKKIFSMDELNHEQSKKTCYIKIENQVESTNALKKLALILEESQSDIPVVLYYPETQKQKKLQKKLWVEDTAVVRNKLYLLFGEQNVIFK